VFISVMYGNLVSEEFIGQRRCYNFHPGLLPQYRGSGAFSWAIINGEKFAGITLHELDVNIDTGPIIERRQFAIEAWDTAETLYKRGMVVIQEMFQSWFLKLLNREYRATEQAEFGEGRTYYRKDLAKVADLTRFVRAFTFEGKPPAHYIDSGGNQVDLRWDNRKHAGMLQGDVAKAEAERFDAVYD
jgi:methionyl-tRNA formyltransferase